MSTLSASGRWVALIDSYIAAEAQIGASAVGLRIARARLDKLAGEVGTDPASVTEADVHAWADSLDVASTSVHDYIKTARAFYAWAARHGHVTTSPLAARERAKIDRKWLDAVEAFTVAEDARGVAPATTRRRAKHVRRFALDVHSSPWQIDAETFCAWLQGLDVSASTRTSMRDSLRAFYRWAVASSRIATDPTTTLSGRPLRLDVPEQWAGPLIEYERHLQARGLSPQTIRAYREHLRTFARDCRALHPFDVTGSDIYEWMAGKQWARETRRGRRTVLRTFYAWAVDAEHMTTNPAAKLPKVRTGEPVARPVTDREYETALRAVDDERWALALRLSAELGLRREEVARIHSADVREGDDGAWWLTVHGKGGKTRVLPLSASLSTALRRRPEGYALPGQIIEKQRHAGEGHISARYLGKQIGQLLPAGVTMHALRHRFATRAYNVNRDVFTLQKLLGHASASTTQRYVQVAESRMRQLVEEVAW